MATLSMLSLRPSTPGGVVEKGVVAAVVGGLVLERLDLVRRPEHAVEPA
jgi:hypothetical protein